MGLRRRVRLLDEQGSTAAEYALMASLVAVVMVLAVVALGGSVSGLFDSAASSVP